MINNIGIINKEDLYINFLLSKTANSNIVDYYKSSNKSIILSNNNSPKNVCIKFKYILERMINLLDIGADTIIHTNACVYSKFYELYEEILRDLGYKFRLIDIPDIKYRNIYKVYKQIKLINKKLNIFRYSYYFLKTRYLMHILNKIEKIIKENIGFEINKGEYISIYKFFRQEINKTTSIRKTYIKYLNKLNKVKINKSIRKRVGVLGYDCYEVSTILGNNQIETIYSNKKDDIQKCLDYIKNGCDSIIYIEKENCIKNFFYMEEIKNICKTYNKNVLFIDSIKKLGEVIL